MTPETSTPENLARRAALTLLRKGLADPADVAKLAGASRQLVRYWIMTAGIDWQAARRDRLAREWGKLMKPRKRR